MTPVKACDKPTACRNQSMTTSSTSVHAGLVIQFMPWGPSPDDTRSPSTDERSVFEGK